MSRHRAEIRGIRRNPLEVFGATLWISEDRRCGNLLRLLRRGSPGNLSRPELWSWCGSTLARTAWFNCTSRRWHRGVRARARSLSFSGSQQVLFPHARMPWLFDTDEHRGSANGGCRREKTVTTTSRLAKEGRRRKRRRRRRRRRWRWRPTDDEERKAHTRAWPSNCSAHRAARTGIMIHNEAGASPRSPVHGFRKLPSWRHSRPRPRGLLTGHTIGRFTIPPLRDCDV